MLRLRAPATGEVFEELEGDDGPAIEEKWRKARHAQAGWQARPLVERVAIVRRFAARVIEQRQELATLLSREMGKPITQGLAEIDALEATIDFFCHSVAEILAPQEWQGSQGFVERISAEALGVVVNISAWNYPYFVGINAFVPALLTGNALLYKPSEFVALTGRQVEALWLEAGLPAGVFQTIIGDAEVGRTLLEGPCDGVFFTGSSRVGKEIGQQMAGRMVPTHLEMGGKDAVYVCDDADVESVVGPIADGAFYNAGQSCSSVERIYVHASKYESFVEALGEYVGTYNIGEPWLADTFLGPVVCATRVKSLEAQVSSALAAGARLIRGGQRLHRPGYYFEPTVVADVHENTSLMRQESFGPVVAVASVANDREAIERINASRFGLTAGIFTPDPSRAETLLTQLQVGTVYWNCCDRASPRLPWTGMKDSAQGVTGGLEGLRACVRPKSWHLKKTTKGDAGQTKLP